MEVRKERGREIEMPAEPQMGTKLNGAVIALAGRKTPTRTKGPGIAQLSPSEPREDQGRVDHKTRLGPAPLGGRI